MDTFRPKFLVGFVSILMMWAFTGCWGEDDAVKSTSELKQNIPDMDLLQLTLPDNQESDQSTRLSRTMAQTAHYYIVTAQTTQDINLSVLGMLTLIDIILEYPPSYSSDTRWEWEQFEPDNGLDATLIKFIMEKESDNRYGYTLEMRHKDTTRADFEPVWYGWMDKSGQTARRGSGEFSIDFDKVAEIDPAARERGQITVVYDIREGVDRSIDIQFNNFRGDDSPEEEAVTGEYHYLDKMDDTGLFQFFLDNTLDINEYGSFLVSFAIETEWLEDGQGQANAYATSTQLQPEGIEAYQAAECWNSSFQRSFYTEMMFMDESVHENLTENPVVFTDEGDIEACPFGFEEVE